MKDRLFEIWFSLRVGVANPAFIPLLETYTPYELFSMNEEDIGALPCDEKLKRALCDKSLEESSRIWQYCRTNGVGILFWQEDAYPISLKSLKDPPLLLYYQGNLPDLNFRLCLAVVGTRSMSEYGKRMAYKIGYELSAVGTVVVSGLALGIDAVAAAGAIAAGGSTVAVLGCGIDVVYPAVHQTLMKEVLKHGAVMTEYPPATRPIGYHFPQRNRIISGLSQGTVVVEAGEKSGALITAEHAYRQGRQLFAVPGNVGEDNAAGTNRLLYEGVTMVLKPKDILDSYAFLYQDTLKLSRLPWAEKHSDLDIGVLERLSVYVRQAPEKDPKPDSDRRGGKKTALPREEQGYRREPDQPRKRPARSETEGLSEEKKQPVSPPVSKRAGDTSEQTLTTLSKTQRELFELLPLDQAVSVDYLVKAGYTMSDIMSAMTMLEIKGLVMALPGGLYARK